jgi:hypothetical protein
MLNKNTLKNIIVESYNKLLLERFINLQSKEEISKYLDTIWDIMQLSYKPIGGFQSASSKEDLLSKVAFAKLVRKDNKIIAAALYKDKLGRKAIAAGSDGTDEGKRAVKQILYEDVKLKRAWGEFSGAAEAIMLKNGGIPIPNSMAEDILGKEILSKDADGYHYTRLIQGEPHKKIIIGNVEGLATS